MNLLDERSDKYSRIVLIKATEKKERQTNYYYMWSRIKLLFDTRHDWYSSNFYVWKFSRKLNSQMVQKYFSHMWY